MFASSDVINVSVNHKVQVDRWDILTKFKLYKIQNDAKSAFFIIKFYSK